MDFYQKYLKYKTKYQELKMLGGALTGSAVYSQNYAQAPVNNNDPYADLHDNKNKAIIASDYYRIKRKEKQCKVLISSKIGSKKQITHKEYENLISYSNVARIPKETLDYCIRSERIKIDPPINAVAPPAVAPPAVAPPAVAPRPVAPPAVAPRPVAPAQNVVSPCYKFLISHIGSKKNLTKKEYENLLIVAQKNGYSKQLIDFCLKKESISISTSFFSNLFRAPSPPKIGVPNPARPPSPPKIGVPNPVASKPIPYGSCSKYITVLLGSKKTITNSEYQNFITDFQKYGINREVFDKCLKEQHVTINNSVPSTNDPIRPPSPPKIGVPNPVRAPSPPKIGVPNPVRAPSPPKIGVPNPNVPNINKQLQPVQPAPLPPIQHKPITDDNLDFFFNFNKSRNHILQKYSNLTNLQSPIKRIGTASANGFINKLTFSNNYDNRQLLIAMKTSRTQDADNNYYEFTVGRCINKIKRCFPNFVYTFDFMNVNPNFKPKIMNDYNNVADFKANVSVKKINEGYESQANNIEAGCVNNKNSSIWLQWIPNSMSLQQVLGSQAFLTNKNTEAFNILFQIYATLSGLKDIYTHYDLHTDNVAFVPVPEGKTILIVYHINGKQYDINTHFIPVILDYGRSHIDCKKFGSTIDSKHFANVGCSITKCRYLSHPSMCKTNSGLYFDRDDKGNYSSPLKQYFIIPANKNISHDLRYLYLFMRSTSQYQDAKAPVNIYGSFSKVDEKSWFSGQVPTYSYGVPETGDAFGSALFKKVKNVHDAIEWLISLHSKIYLNNPIVNAPKFGRMNIYPEVNKGLFEWTFTQ